VVAQPQPRAHTDHSLRNDDKLVARRVPSAPVSLFFLNPGYRQKLNGVSFRCDFRDCMRPVSFLFFFFFLAVLLLSYISFAPSLHSRICLLW